MSITKGTYLEAFADTLAQIMWKPNTARDLAALTDKPRQTIDGHIKALHDAGVIYVAGLTSKGARVWAMQPGAPFAVHDNVEVIA